jgi:hypothetical protein
MGWSELHQCAAGRRFVTYAEAEACGVPRSTLDARAHREKWPPRPHPAVVVLPGPPLTQRETIQAAVASVGEHAVVGGQSALWLHGLLDRPPSRTELWVPPPYHARSDAGRIVRRTSLLTPDDTVDVQGIATLAFPWVMRDLAGRRSLERLRYLALDGRFAGLLPDGALDPVLERDHRFRGRAALAQVAADLLGDGSDSGFEFSMRDRLADRGLPPDEGQHELWTPGRPRSIDLPYLGPEVGVECVGLAYHRSRAQLESDAERANDIAAVGSWPILQCTWPMQFGRAFDRFVDRLQRAIASRS